MPVGCELLVVAEPFSHVQEIQSFSFKANSTEPYPNKNMTKATLEHAWGSRFSFSLTSGPGMTQLYLDEIVVVELNNDCSGD